MGQGFGFDEPQGEPNQAEGNWASMDMFGESRYPPPLDFAKSNLEVALNVNTKNRAV